MANPIDIGSKIYKVLEQLFGKAFARNMIGTQANVVKPKAMDSNAPTGNIYSKKMLENNPGSLSLAEEKIREYAPSILANKNVMEQMNFLENAENVLNIKKKETGSIMKDPTKTKTAKEADVVDIRTQEKVKPEGIMKLKTELGLPEGVEPGSLGDRAIRDSAQYKMDQQGVKSILDENYKPPKSELTLEEEEAIANIGARSYSAVQEGKRRAVIRQVLLKDTRIDLPDNVKNSLKNYDDLRGGGDPEMDPLKVFEDYYERDNEVLGTLDGIIDTAENEFKAADTFLSGKNFKVKKPMVRESLDDEAVEMEETKDLGERLEDLPDDIDPDSLASGGRVGFFAGTAAKGLLKLIQSKLGDDAIKMASEIDRPESALNRDMFGEFNERMSRKTLDVEETPPGFKLSREKLLENFPEIDEDFADEIMTMDRDMQLRIIAMLRDRRKNPEAYDKLLMEKGDTLDFQGEFDRSVQRDKNAGGGLSYLMGM